MGIFDCLKRKKRGTGRDETTTCSGNDRAMKLEKDVTGRKCPLGSCNDDGKCMMCGGTGETRDFSVSIGVASTLGIKPMKDCPICEGTGKCSDCQYCTNCEKELGDQVYLSPKYSGYYCSEKCAEEVE